MRANSLPKSWSVTGQLLAKVARLSDEQNAALETATFVGMTDDEAREIDERRDSIARLLNQLAAICREKPQVESGHQEIPDEQLDVWLQKRQDATAHDTAPSIFRACSRYVPDRQPCSSAIRSMFTATRVE